ncbi:probable transcription factor PosF21 [Asparagus officinalis]|uniref:probable transcription factor PosF21 n=1 Tax=Asparagus officinalis TaxID=4686 RepID=UPI00098E5A45|nr:probable transcription factor PosF21 [Asparagus officinalis]XP_020248085.1 probable transcription factor PosF21 [Asparagus officinalis]XP_020248086.1 probable transcription factor PosF21 [Asparagus officinalis]
MEKDVLSPSSSNIFSHDISGMSDFPLRNPGHRRAQSEIPSLPVDLNLDGDLGIVGPADEMEDDFLAMYLDMDKLGGESSEAAVVGAGNGGAYSSSSSSDLRNENPRVRHQHSQSMDGSTEFLGANSEGPTSLAEAKKAMSAAKLAELALVDPKKAKRIWANRQSATRSKERKMRYIAELERKLRTLQIEATTFSAQLSMLQRDTTALTAENNELKLRLQTVEQQVHLQDALNNALREEVQRLKMATGQMMPNGPMMNFGQPSFGGNQQFYHQNQNKTMQPLPATHQQQLQIRQPQYQHQQQQQPPGDFRLRATLSQHGQRESIAGSGNANGVIR